MRIISGSARGKKLETPAGSAIRPTTDRVKEAVFDILQFSLAGARMLDLFAGTGQMGIEAISRGAASCTFVEQSKKAAALIGANVRRAGFERQAEIYSGDVFRFLAGRGQAEYDLVYADPPYRQVDYQRLLQGIVAGLTLSDGARILLESERGVPLPDGWGPFRIKKRYRYGKTAISLYLRAVANEGDSENENSDLSRQF